MTRRPGAQVIPRPATARPGQPAPWADAPADRRHPDLARVRAALADAPPPRPLDVDITRTRPSAVLAPIYPEGDEAMVVLTRRARTLRAHRGEVSFPGGARDAGDADLRHTAVREAHEEIGLDPAAVEIIGELDHLQTISSSSYIVPFVGELAARPELVASPDEVEAILYVPLAELMADGVYHEERWAIGTQERPIHFFELDGDVVWGATAAILRNFLSLLTDTAAR